MVQCKIFSFFQGMSNRVPKIKKRSFALFHRVFLYDRFFDIAASDYHFFQSIGISVAYFIHIFQKPDIKNRITNQPMLHDFRESRKILSFFQRF